ncbi:Brp/Blh family beta-carotene 15,15'-dioxygenase [Aureimonas jatrophae]|uniref:Probable beta-carotene 15,15'-dioxygenase n=1 Tax=Aureimonas jatrophae TaxID=1166073 RepID=A0A1H0HY94_9HYPH|nr:Brp/Blh family beta-carotene 15,15'-dioxygenase [Aureimonas jatrophae]MBB3950825.1 Brp/Blh family beta-carotene 15,15'-monooxygenase [Aureimonas jatrophae]SDO23820.1 beta-carotene 15,15'-monooxygenase, Brp/Blh family [Aureimonas jatrophae]
MTLTLASPSVRPDGRTGASLSPLGRLAVALGLALAGVGAEWAGGFVPFAFAAVLILVLGLPHGASDHLAALRGRPWREAPGRLALFLFLYLAAVAATLALWRVAPGVALAAFLALSTLHFALDDVAAAPWHQYVPERLARGLMPVTLPALLHGETLAQLFSALSTPEDGAALARTAALLAPLVLVLVLAAALLRWLRHEREPAAEIALGAVALLVFPPLVGFALVFAPIHSRGQTRERMAELGLPDLGRYLRACAPTLFGAALLFGALGLLFAGGRAPALGPLFVGLAALTVPHMLVTPLFARAP